MSHGAPSSVLYLRSIFESSSVVDIVTCHFTAMSTQQFVVNYGTRLDVVEIVAGDATTASCVAGGAGGEEVSSSLQSPLTDTTTGGSHTPRETDSPTYHHNARAHVVKSFHLQGKVVGMTRCYERHLFLLFESDDYQLVRFDMEQGQLVYDMQGALGVTTGQGSVFSQRVRIAAPIVRSNKHGTVVAVHAYDQLLHVKMLELRPTTTATATGAAKEGHLSNGNGNAASSSSGSATPGVAVPRNGACQVCELEFANVRDMQFISGGVSASSKTTGNGDEPALIVLGTPLTGGQQQQGRETPVVVRGYYLNPHQTRLVDVMLSFDASETSMVLLCQDATTVVALGVDEFITCPLVASPSSPGSPSSSATAKSIEKVPQPFSAYGYSTGTTAHAGEAVDGDAAEDDSRSECCSNSTLMEWGDGVTAVAQHVLSGDVVAARTDGYLYRVRPRVNDCEEAPAEQLTMLWRAPRGHIVRSMVFVPSDGWLMIVTHVGDVYCVLYEPSHNERKSSGQQTTTPPPPSSMRSSLSLREQQQHSTSTTGSCSGSSSMLLAPPISTIAGYPLDSNRFVVGHGYGATGTISLFESAFAFDPSLELAVEDVSNIFVVNDERNECSYLVLGYHEATRVLKLDGNGVEDASSSATASVLKQDEPTMHFGRWAVEGCAENNKNPMLILQITPSLLQIVEFPSPSSPSSSSPSKKEAKFSYRPDPSLSLTSPSAATTFDHAAASDRVAVVSSGKRISVLYPFDLAASASSSAEEILPAPHYEFPLVTAISDFEHEVSCLGVGRSMVCVGLWSPHSSIHCFGILNKHQSSAATHDIFDKSNTTVLSLASVPRHISIVTDFSLVVVGSVDGAITMYDPRKHPRSSAKKSQGELLYRCTQTPIMTAAGQAASPSPSPSFFVIDGHKILSVQVHSFSSYELTVCCVPATTTTNSGSGNTPASAAESHQEQGATAHESCSSSHSNFPLWVAFAGTSKSFFAPSEAATTAPSQDEGDAGSLVTTAATGFTMLVLTRESVLVGSIASVPSAVCVQQRCIGKSVQQIGFRENVLLALVGDCGRWGIKALDLATLEDRDEEIPLLRGEEGTCICYNPSVSRCVFVGTALHNSEGGSNSNSNNAASPRRGRIIMLDTHGDGIRGRLSIAQQTAFAGGPVNDVALTTIRNSHNEEISVVVVALENALVAKALRTSNNSFDDMCTFKITSLSCVSVKARGNMILVGDIYRGVSIYFIVSTAVTSDPQQRAGAGGKHQQQQQKEIFALVEHAHDMYQGFLTACSFVPGEGPFTFLKADLKSIGLLECPQQDNPSSLLARVLQQNSQQQNPQQSLKQLALVATRQLTSPVTCHTSVRIQPWLRARPPTVLLSDYDPAILVTSKAASSESRDYGYEDTGDDIDRDDGSGEIDSREQGRDDNDVVHAAGGGNNANGAVSQRCDPFCATTHVLIGGSDGSVCSVCTIPDALSRVLLTLRYLIADRIHAPHPIHGDFRLAVGCSAPLIPNLTSYCALPTVEYGTVHEKEVSAFRRLPKALQRSVLGELQLDFPLMDERLLAQLLALLHQF